MRVGRTALDEDVIRLLEAHHPDVSFDWPKILDGRVSEAPEEQAPGGRPEPRAAPNASPEGARQARRRNRRDGAELPPSLPPAQGTLEFVPPPMPASEVAPALDAVPPLDEVPADEADEADASEAVAAEPPARRMNAADERFSPEDLARLRGRYAALLSRIDQYTTDAAQAGEVRGRVETLNPDTWVTPADVRQALEHYEATYKALRDVLGWAHGSRRRRRRKPAIGQNGQTPA